MVPSILFQSESTRRTSISSVPPRIAVYLRHTSMASSIPESSMTAKPPMSRILSHTLCVGPRGGMPFLQETSPCALAASRAGSLRQSFCQARRPASNEMLAQAK